MSPVDITVTKIGYTIPVSCCVLGTCDHDAPKLDRWQSLRLRVRSWWDSNLPRVHRGPCDRPPRLPTG